MIIRQQRLRAWESWTLEGTENFRMRMNPSRNLFTNGSRTFDGVDQWANAPQRAIGTSDVSWCGWVYVDPTIADNSYIYRNHDSGSDLSFSIYRSLANASIFVMVGFDGVLNSFDSANGIFTTGQWHFLVVNLDRDGQVQVFLNDMTTPVIDEDISDSDGEDWGDGFAWWAIGGSGSSAFLKGSMSRIGIIVGDLLDATDRNHLYNNGNGRFYSELSGNTATKFSGQDYFNLNETAATDNFLNQATPARPAAKQNDPGVGSGPREATAGDMEGGYHAVLKNFTDTITCWSDDTPDGSYTYQEKNYSSIPGISDETDGDAEVSPYNISIGSTANVEAAAGSAGRDFLSVRNKSKIRQGGTIHAVKLYTDTSNYTRIGELRIKVWRKNGSGTFDLVNKSDDLSSQLTGGTQTLTCSIPGCQPGDYLGIYIVQPTTGGPTLCAVTAGAFDEKLYYTISGEMSDSSADWESEASIARTIILESYMDPPQVAIIGDSITNGSQSHLSDQLAEDATQAYPHWVGATAGVTYQNLGIGGQQASDILSRFDADVVALQPNAAVVLVGVNDVSGSTTLASYQDSITAIYEKCMRSRIRPIFVKILPWTAGTNTQAATIDTWNDWLDTFASTRPEVTIVDATAEMGQFRTGGDPGNLWDLKTAYDNDGVHLTPAGYQALGTYIGNAISGLTTKVIEEFDAEVLFCDDADLARVQGPEGNYLGLIKDLGTLGYNGYVRRPLNGSRSLEVPKDKFVGASKIAYDQTTVQPPNTGAREADGVDQLFATSSSPAFGTDDVTIEGWFYRNSSADAMYMIGFGASSASTAGIGITHSSGGIVQGFVSDGTSQVQAQDSFLIPTGEWFHVLFSIDRTADTATLYVNGCFAGQGDISGLAADITPSGNKSIFAYKGDATAYTWDGRGANIRVSIGKAYDTDEVAIAYNGGTPLKYADMDTTLKASVTHAWDLDGATGTDESDLVGSINLTQVGTDTTIDAAPGPFLRSYDGWITGPSSSPRDNDIPSNLSGVKSVSLGATDYITMRRKCVTERGPRTIAFWVKGSAASSKYLFSEGANNSHSGLAIYLASGKPQILLCDASGSYILNLTHGDVCLDDDWHSVVFTWDGTTNANGAKLYVDGVVANGTVTELNHPTATYESQWNGYNGANGGTAFKLCLPVIEQGRAWTAAEVSAYNTDGSVPSTITSQMLFNEPDSCDLPVNLSMVFETGTDKDIELTDEKAFLETDSWTVEGWVYLEDSVTMFAFGDENSVGMSIGFNSGAGSTAVLSFRDDDSDYHSASLTMSLNQWYHFAQVYDNGVLRQYVNGVLVGEHKTLSALEFNNIGNAYTNENYPLVGKLAALSVHDIAATSQQIRNAAKGSILGAPLLRYRFDTLIDLGLTHNKALNFDGVGTQLDTNSECVSPVGAATFMAWIKAESLGEGSAARIFDDGETVLFLATGSDYSLRFASNSSTASTVSPTVGEFGTWHHVAVTRDASGTSNFYIDGRPAGTADQASGTPTASANDMFIGNNLNGNRTFDGDISDPRIYHRELTHAEIMSIVLNDDEPNDLLARWKLGQEPRSIPNVAGGQSVVFDGTNDIIESDGTGLTSVPENFTVSLWMRWDGSYDGSYSGVFCIDDFEMAIAVASVNRLRGYVGMSSYAHTHSSNNAVEKGRWQHIAMKFSTTDNKVRLYLDGVEDTATPTVGVTPMNSIASDKNFEIGEGLNSAFSGKIDDVRLYLTALDDDDIAALAAGSDPATSPDYHWTLDDGPQGGSISDGDPICAWTSDTGDKITFRQADRADCPIYEETAVNNLPAIVLDGNSTYLETSELVLDQQAGAIQLVIDPDDADPMAWFSECLENAANWGYVRTTGGTIRMATNNGATSQLYCSTDNDIHVYTLFSDGDTTYIMIDDELQTLTVTGANDGEWFGDMSGLDRTIIGAVANALYGQYADGQLYELITWNGVPTIEDLLESARVLMAKYSI